VAAIEGVEPVEAGLRQRKKQQTRAAIQQAALRLFLDKGYESITTSEIARAADVSAGTLFNYFPTKESLLADEFDPIFIQHLGSRPPKEPIFTAVRHALRVGLAEAPEMLDLSLARGKLILATPALRAAKRLEDDRDAGRLAALLAARVGHRADDFELMVISRLIVGAVVAAYEAWVADDGQGDIIALVDQALTIAEAAGCYGADSGL
jgi:AcrR family transcriptional regulator